MSELNGAVDYALVAFLEDGDWQLQDIASPAFESVDSLSHALRQVSGPDGAVGMIAVDEDFFVLVRVAGGRARLLISDVTAATEWPIARQIVDELDIPLADDDDEQVPAGDLAIIADLGMSAMDLGALCDDVDLYPEEMLEEIAEALGFGNQFHDAIEAVG